MGQCQTPFAPPFYQSLDFPTYVPNLLVPFPWFRWREMEFATIPISHFATCPLSLQSRFPLIEFGEARNPLGAPDKSP